MPHPEAAPTASPDLRWVSVIAPCRNERDHIDAFCTDALAQQLPPGWSLELCIADGQSDDGTRGRLQQRAAEDPRLRWIDNPGRIVSTGLNRALADSRGEVVVRMDIHTTYAADYVAAGIAALAATGADNVGGPWRAEPADGAAPMPTAVAAAFQSRWVAGGADSRRVDHAGEVDTVYLGCWPRDTFDRFGGFDEALVRNQDDEHNLRIRLGGGRVWQTPTMHSRYRPRSSLRAVFRQWFQYGYWKPFVIVKHRQPAAGRHLLVTLWGVAVALAALAAMLGAPAWPLWTLVLGYAVAVAAATVAIGVDTGLPMAVLLRVPAVIAATHFGYGLGSWPGWWDALRGRAGRGRFGVLTR
ncbi:MAG: glycosyltransferase family 2 protein [Rubrivivax sp.]